METAKRNRTQQRRLFTKACNEFDAEEASLEISDKIIKLKIIEEKASLMINSEENVKQFLFSEEVDDAVIDKEIDDSESYIDRWRLLQLKLQKLSLAEKEEVSSNCSVSQQNTLLRYPKIQLPTFNGDIRSWIRFWGQFEKVDKDHNLDLHDKFAYLSQCMEKGSVAEELIKSFPPGGNSYEKAIEQLKLRYGREELLIQVYVRDLLSLVLQKTNMPKRSLRNLYDLLETKLRALEILGVTRDKYAAMLFPLVESALPEETLLAWERYRSTSRRSHDEENQNSKITTKSDLDSILEFLQDEVQAEERIILASHPSNEENVPCHYLPHRPVIKENSTTRIRPVFDASARKKGSPSLNDCLEKGPNLIEMIPSVLAKFRLEEIGLIADIKKAFLQISVSQSDKNFLRFLWKDSNNDRKIYRHCRVVFGTSCSPFLLGAAIQYHLQNALEQPTTYSKEIIQKLLGSFYVDNCITSVKNEAELQCFIDVATSIMAERKFDLRGWEYTNSAIPFSPPTNVLGLLWNKTADTLSLNLSNLKDLGDEKITKRVILAFAHKVFDPLGITCPVALIPKLLLQRLWKTGIGWDQEVDLEAEQEFRRWVKSVLFLSTIEIPRWIRFRSDDEKQSLHVFCDASKVAYATCTFLRVERENTVYVQLIQAKARVSPCGKKETSIARLELLGATIAARLSSNILKDLPVRNVYFWTDSTTVLAWLRRKDSWGVFVQNRVDEILSLTSKEDWKFVPGTMNPADLPSRGCIVRQLSLSKWWEGPEWLYSPPVLWPNSEDIIREGKG